MLRKISVVLALIMFVGLTLLLLDFRGTMMTALVSPMVNFALFGMPSGLMLWVVMAKSMILAVVASLVAARQWCSMLASIAVVIISYKALGVLVEWAILGDASLALAHLRIALPGLATQLLLIPPLIKLLK